MNATDTKVDAILLDAIAVPAFAVDREGKISAWNRAIHELTGRSPEDLVGKAYALGLFGKKRSGCVDRALADGSVGQDEIAVSGVQGEVRALLSARPFPAGAIATLVPERGNAEMTQLAQAVEATQQKLQGGDFEASVPEDLFQGPARLVASAINAISQAHVENILKILEVLSAYAIGDFSVELEKLPGKQAYANEILDRVRNNLIAVINELDRLTNATANGKLGTRGDVSKHQGDYGRIIKGFNLAIDSVIKPLKLAADSLNAIGMGEIPEPVTNELKGDYNDIGSAINNCVRSLQSLQEVSPMLQKLSLNDLSASVNGKYPGIFGDLAESANGVGARMKHIHQIVIMMGHGDMSKRIELGKVGRRCENDELVPAFVAAMTAIQTIIDDMHNMSKQHEAGDIDFFVQEDKYEGVYQQVAHGVNNMVRDHIALIRKSLACVAEFGKGNFDAPLEKLPGKKAFINEGIEQLRSNLKNISGAINHLVEDCKVGNLSSRAQADAFLGDWATLIQGLNAMLDAVLAPITEGIATLEKLAERELTARVQGDFRGDHAKLKNTINKTAEALHDALAHVAQAVDQITSSSAQIASGSQAVAQGASEQASALEETSSSMEEMSGMTQQNADNTQQAKNLAESTRAAADKGAKAMANMLESMGKIQAAAEGTAVIISDINEIAFQTNLLALNAAVEAARAGDAGRGFAVVAEEVRNLAQRSKEAAKKTEELIKESVKLAERGQVISQDVNGNLNEITESVGKVTNIVGEIAAASREQAKGILQVNKALAEMDKVTQQNAANSEQSSSTAEELAGQAQELAAMVGRFQLARMQTLRGGGGGRGRALGPAGPRRGTDAAKPSRLGNRGKAEGGGIRLQPEDVIPLDSDPDFAKF